jgi:hypothetical protein
MPAGVFQPNGLQNDRAEHCLLRQSLGTSLKSDSSQAGILPRDGSGVEKLDGGGIGLGRSARRVTIQGTGSWMTKAMGYGRSLEVDDRPGRLQYSLRALLVLMTFCCLALSLLSYVSIPLWVLPMLGILAWSALVVGHGRAALATATSYRKRRPSGSPWLPARRRAAVLLASLAAIGPVITLLLFIGAFSCAGLDIDHLSEIGLVVNEFTGSDALGSRGVWATSWLALAYANLASILLNVVSYSIYWRSRTDLAMFAMRLFGLMSSSSATCAALVCYLSG